MRTVMLWWFVAAVGGWLATGALIPVLWKLSKLVSDEEPTSTEVMGAVLSVPVVGVASIVDTAATK
jgi:hypothetical protein